MTELNENEEHQACLTLAKQGRVYAQMRLAWLYFSSEQEEYLQEAYNWLKPAGKYDDSAKLVSKILLFIYGTNDEERAIGYEGIQQLVNQGFPPAEAYLATVYFLNENLEPKTQNPNWLINKAYEKTNSVLRVEDLAIINMNGFGSKANREKAKTLLIESAKDFPTGANNVAWMTATYSGTALFEPEYAIELAESVIADERYTDEYVYVDTLAAAYAANNQFAEAVTTQARALKLLRQEKAKLEQHEDAETGNAAIENAEAFANEINDLQARLTLYEAGEKATYNSFDVEQKAFFENIQSYIEGDLLYVLEYATEQFLHQTTGSMPQLDSNVTTSVENTNESSS